MQNIKLNNNYIVQVMEIDDLRSDVDDIQLITWKNIKKKKNLTIRVNFSSFSISDYKRLLKKFYYLKNKACRYNLSIGSKNNDNHVVAFLYNFNKYNKHLIDFINCLNASLYNNKVDMYNYIYDEACEFLDKEFSENNLCNFINDRCAYKRETSCTVGCCRHFRNKLIPLTKLVTCEYLKNKSCTAKCISCKLFTCDYLQKKRNKI